MEGSEKQDQEQINGTRVKTFSVPFAVGAIKENISISTNTRSIASKEQIINQAFKFHSQGNILEASKYYQHAIDQGSKEHRVFSNYGVILKSLGKFEEAERCQRKAIELNPNYAKAHSNLGGILRDRGNLQEAELFTRKAIELNADLAEAHSNLGGILSDRGNLQEAELFTRKAIEIKPDYAEAYLNLGIILRDRGNLEEAEIYSYKASELNPELPKAYEILGLILLENGKYELSLKYFSKSFKLLRGAKAEENNHWKFKLISKAKIEHDIEQLEYLISKDYDTKKFKDLVILYKKVAAEINWPSETQLISLSNKHTNLLKSSFNRLINLTEAPKSKEKVINPELNIEKITNNYFEHEFGLTYIDNFLSPKALECLREFLLGSTIWFDIKPNGYLGAYLGEGLANPLIIQIANELRKKFPKIFKDYPINKIWAYKYDSRNKNNNSTIKGINIHADFAAVNVNFWITPNAANLSPNSGGLIVYDVEAPKDWDFKTYNQNEQKIREELKKSKGNTKVIPHKENRAVVFNSNLFHETDSYEFKEGYENRRINVTLLFGRRENN